MTAIAAAPEPLRLSSAIAEGVRLAARRPVTLLLLSIFLGLLPAAASMWVSLQALGAERAARAAGDFWRAWGWAGASMAVGFAMAGVNWIYQGAVARMAAQGAGLTTADLDILGPRAVWLFAAGAVTNLIVTVATIALIVPGLLLGLAWCMSPAVLAVEGPGPKVRMWRRSAELTRGHRLGLLGLLIAYEALKLALVYGVRYAVDAPTPLVANAGPAWLVFGLQPVISGAMSLIYAAVMGCVYLELRRLHDGGLAATFD